jgi:hypothetical protein
LNLKRTLQRLLHTQTHNLIRHLPTDGAGQMVRRSRPVAKSCIFTITVTYSKGGSSGGAKRMIVKAGEKFVQVGAGEGPLKGSGSLLVVVLEGEQTLLEFGEGGEVIGSENLALNNGEIDLDLIEPAGMDRGVDEHDRGPRGAQAVGGFFAAVGGTVVGNPKDAPRGAIGFYRHDLFYEAVKWLDTGGVLAAAEEPGAMDIPGGNVRAGTGALVLVLDAGATARCGRERRMDADAGLDAGFLVGRQHKVAAAQWRALPATLVEIKHPTGLGGEVGVAWEDPASVSPWAQRVAAEPAPQGRAADLGHDPFGHDLTLKVGERPARQGQSAAVRQFAHQRLNRDDDAGGKSGRVPRRAVPLRGRGSHVQRSACAICSQSGAAYPSATR